MVNYIVLVQLHTDEYRQYIEKDAALERRFSRKYWYRNPIIDITIAILRGLANHFWNLIMLNNSRFGIVRIIAAAHMSDGYITRSFLAR